MSSRFSPSAAKALADAIIDAGGVEVFAIVDVEERTIVAVEITCRGTIDRVPALLGRPRSGQAVVHNHPSGNLLPSEADFRLAHLWGEDGVGVVITNNDCTKSNWVVEPFQDEKKALSRDRLNAFFSSGLKRSMSDFEPRREQTEMAHAVADCLDRNRPVAIEAGTGTGKSLAYLVPAALWALKNDAKVVVSTYTKSLQAQLMFTDLPLLKSGGIEVKSTILQGRNNYLCKRRLQLATEAAQSPSPELPQLEALASWSKSTQHGSRSDVQFSIESEVWERVHSDSDLSLSMRCPHYENCHYYNARKRAASAHVIVVNHALLLADLALRAENGRGVLPAYDRIVIDEAHHLEDAATGAISDTVTALAIRRSCFSLIDRKRSTGALTSISRSAARVFRNAIPENLDDRLVVANELTKNLVEEAVVLLHQVGVDLLGLEERTLRITNSVSDSEAWQTCALPTIRHLQHSLREAAKALMAIDELLDGHQPPELLLQPYLDVRRCKNRLLRYASVCDALVLGDDENRCRWVSWDRKKTAVSLSVAPIEVGEVLQNLLWNRFPGTVCTSATLTVNNRFGHFQARVGLLACNHLALPSPFNHRQQAILGLPCDLPAPAEPFWRERSERVIAEAVAMMDGGCFVLCTSHADVNSYGRMLQSSGRPVFIQGTKPRSILLKEFQRDRRSVLVGTDSFWEGVSVKGAGLRLVIIPKLPFRVPSDPLEQARHEALVRRGKDPFRTYTLPAAILKLKQGYGRLIRSKTDFGAVLILDPRLHTRRYGMVITRSLPPARRVTGNWKQVQEILLHKIATDWRHLI